MSVCVFMYSKNRVFMGCHGIAIDLALQETPTAGPAELGPYICEDLSLR